jgi:hypothetical protein
MSSSASLAPPAKSRLVVVCQRCGGSGTLRLADGRFRTCLECLGQGKRMVPMASAEPERLGTSGSAHPRPLRSPDEEGCRADDRS